MICVDMLENAVSIIGSDGEKPFSIPKGDRLDKVRVLEGVKAFSIPLTIVNAKDICDELEKPCSRPELDKPEVVIIPVVAKPCSCPMDDAAMIVMVLVGT